MRITGGSVTFSKVHPDASHGVNRKAEYHLAFALDDDDTDYDTLLRTAGQIALRKAYDLLGLDVPQARPSTAKTELPAPAPFKPVNIAPAPEAAAPASPPDDDDVPGTPPRRPPGRPKGAGVKKPLIAPTPEQYAADPGRPQPVPTVEVQDSLEDILSAPKEISDVALQNAAQKVNAEIRNAPLIRQLATKFGVVAGMPVATMPQNQRAAYIVALEELKAPKPV